MEAMASTIITVTIHDMRSSSDWKPEIKIQINNKSTTFDICNQISNETNILDEERSYYTLLLLSTTSSLRRLGTKIHCMHTLRSDEIISKAYQEITDRVPNKISRNGGSGYSNSDDVAAQTTYKWIFKDSRSVPIDFGDEADLSGDESSDDELELLPCDLQYIRQSDRKAFMLKRSRKDPNCWKKRYCVITDKFWCINTKYESPRAICLSLNSSVRIFDVRPAYNYQNAVILKEATGSYYFRASSTVDQQNWINELTSRISYQTDHETIHLAEFIACDEELAMCNRQQKATATITHSNIFRSVLSEVSNESIWMALSTGNLSEVLNHRDNSSGARSRKQSQLTNSPTSSTNTLIKQVSGYLPAPLSFTAIEDPVLTNSPLATPRDVTNNYTSSSSHSNHNGSTENRLHQSIDSNGSVETEPRRADRQSLISASSLLSSDPYSRFTNRGTSLALSLRIHRRGMQWLWDGMQERHPLLMKAMQFLQAVQYYRDMHRHDVEQSPRHIWMVLINIHHYYLANLPMKSDHTTNGAALEQLQAADDQILKSMTEYDDEENVEWLPTPSVWRETGTPSSEPASSYRSRPQSSSKLRPIISPHYSSKLSENGSTGVVSDEHTIWNVKPTIISRICEYIETKKPKASRFMSRMRPTSIAQFVGSAAASLTKHADNSDKLRKSRPESLVSDISIAGSDSQTNGISTTNTTTNAISANNSANDYGNADFRPSGQLSVDTRVSSSQNFFTTWFGSNTSTSSLFNPTGTISTTSNSDHREQSLLSAARSSIVNPATQASIPAPVSTTRRRGSNNSDIGVSKAAKRREFELDLCDKYQNYDLDSSPPSITILDDLLLEIEKGIINCTTRIPFNLNCRLRDSSSFRGLNTDSDSMSVYSENSHNDPLRPKARRFGFVFRKKFVPSSANATQQNAARQSYSRLKHIFEVANGQGAKLINSVANISTKSAKTLISGAGNSRKSVFSDAASRYSMLLLKGSSHTPPTPRQYRGVSVATIEGDAKNDDEDEEYVDEEVFDESVVDNTNTLQTYLELVDDIASSAKSFRSLSALKKTFSRSEFSSPGTPVASPGALSGKASNSSQSGGELTGIVGIPANRPMLTSRVQNIDTNNVPHGIVSSSENVAGNRTSLIRPRWDSDSVGRPSENDSTAYAHSYRDEELLNDRFGDMSFHFEPYTGSRTPSTQSPQKLSGLVGISPEERESYALNQDYYKQDGESDEDREQQHEVTG